MIIPNANQSFQKRTIKNEVKIGPLSIQFIVIIILAAIALFYLAQSTQGATENYKLQQLRDQKEKLQTETERLEVESARIKSINEIKKSADSLGMEETK